jgi:hypothetical protein
MCINPSIHPPNGEGNPPMVIGLIGVAVGVSENKLGVGAGSFGERKVAQARLRASSKKSTTNQRGNWVEWAIGFICYLGDELQ